MKVKKQSESIQFLWNNVAPCRVQGFLVRIHESQANYSTISVIIPKKKVKQAVRRNRIKRCVREAIRLLYQETQIYHKGRSYDILVVLYQDFGDISTKKYHDVFYTCWKSSIT